MFKLHKPHLSGSIHSGHFMVSRLDDDEEDNNDAANDSGESEGDNTNSVEIEINNPASGVDVTNNLDLTYQVESPSNTDEHLTSWNDLDRPAKHLQKQNQYLTYYTNSYHASNSNNRTSQDDSSGMVAIDATMSRRSRGGKVIGTARSGSIDGSSLGHPNSSSTTSGLLDCGRLGDATSDRYNVGPVSYAQDANGSPIGDRSKSALLGANASLGGNTCPQLNHHHHLQIMQSPPDNQLVMQRHLQPRHAGLKLRLKNKIRLNNLIWRTWFLQYIRGRRPPGCQFKAPAESDVHQKSETVVLEGKYWKRKEKAILDEYRKWRIFTVRKSQIHLFRPSSFDWDSRVSNLASFSSLYGSEYEHYYPDYDMNIAYNLDDLPPMLEVEPSDHEQYYPPILHPSPPPPASAQQQQPSSTTTTTITQPTPLRSSSVAAVAAATATSNQLLSSNDVGDNASTVAHQTQQQQQLHHQHNQQQQQLHHQQQPQVPMKMIEHSLPMHHHHQLQHHAQAATLQQHDNTSSSSVGATSASQPQQQLTHMQVPKNLSHQQALSLKREQQQQQSLNSQHLQQQQHLNQQAYGASPAGVPTSNNQADHLSASTSNYMSTAPQPSTAAAQRSVSISSAEWDPVEYQKVYQSLNRSAGGGSSSSIEHPSQIRTIASSPPMHHVQHQQGPQYQHQQQPLSSPEQSISTGSEYLYSLDGAPVGRQSGGGGGHRESDQKRACHINAEQKRRCNIKNGFDTLKSILPSINQNVNVKISKASMLQKAALYISALSAEQKHQADEQAVLRQQIEQLKHTIQAYQGQLPASGGPVGCQSSSQARDMLQNYVKRRTLENWKFWIFSLIIEPLFETYYNSVSTTSFADSCKTISHWLDRNCGLVSLRKEALDSLTFLSTSTNILNTPQTLPTEAVDAVTYHQNQHQASISQQQLDQTGAHLHQHNQQQHPQQQHQQIHNHQQHHQQQQQQQQQQARVSAALAAAALNPAPAPANLYMNNNIG